jgi:hypothetical protein
LTALEATPAAAQPEDQLAEARRLFAEGLQLGEQGRWEDAAGRFRQVMQIRAAPAVAYNLAVALEQLDQFVEADDLARSAAADPQAPANVRSDAQNLMRRLRTRIGRITVRVTGDTTGIEVHLDGVALPEGHVEDRRVNPGTRTVALLRGGRTLTTRDVRVSGGGRETVTLEAPAVTAEPVPDPDPQPDPDPVVPAPSDIEPIPDSPLDPADSPPRDDGGGGGGVLSQWWFWAGVAVVAAGTIALVLLLQPSDPTAVQGNLGLVNVHPTP